jgi:hypothetical protein
MDHGSLFHKYRRLMTVETDRLLGESFSLIAMVQRPNVKRAPDPSRPTTQVRGHFAEPDLAISRSRFTGFDGMFDRSTTKPTARIERANLPWEIRRGDIIVRELTGERYIVETITANGQGRITFALEAER